MTKQNHCEFIGIDYGEKSIGIAKSSAGIAFPHHSLFVSGTVKSKCSQLVAYLTDHQLLPSRAIIVGHPIGMQNQITDQTKIVELFVKHLKEMLPNTSIELIDERLTSKESQHYQNSTKHKHKKNPDIDKISASLILKTYIDIHGR